MIAGIRQFFSIYVAIVFYSSLTDAVSDSLTRRMGFYDSPVAPRIANCRGAKPLHKRTEKKYLVCSMFKDEQGYLAEFLGYYRAHGFNHAILWDHGSSDGFMEELSPWLADGFAEVRSVHSLDHLPSIQKTKRFRQKSSYHRAMAQKKEVERQCFRWGFAHQYDYYLTADLDEYVVPLYNSLTTSLHGLEGRLHGEPYITLADAIDEVFSRPVAERVVNWKGPANASRPIQYASITLVKANFNANPHVLEPMDLLQVEAYQTRLTDMSRMSFYTRVQPKMVYRLSGVDITGGPREFNNGSHTLAQEVLANCCFFHGCNGALPNANPPTVCSAYRGFFKHSPETIWQTTSSSRYWLRMNHYARSLEKFALKQLTWETANQESNSYELAEYMTRTFGWVHDPTAAQFGCAAKREIRAAHRRYFGAAVPVGVDFVGEHLGPETVIRAGGRWLRRAEYANATAVPINPTLFDVVQRGDVFLPALRFQDYYDSA